MAYPGFITVKEMGMVKSADSQSYMESPLSAVLFKGEPALAAALGGQPGRKGRNLTRALTTTLGGLAGIAPGILMADHPLSGLATIAGGAFGALAGHHLGSIGDKYKRDNDLVSREGFAKQVLGRALLGSILIPGSVTVAGSLAGLAGGAGLASLTGAKPADSVVPMVAGGLLGGLGGGLGGLYLGSKYQRWLDKPIDKAIRSALTDAYSIQDPAIRQAALTDLRKKLRSKEKWHTKQSDDRVTARTLLGLVLGGLAGGVGGGLIGSSAEFGGDRQMGAASGAALGSALGGPLGGLIGYNVRDVSDEDLSSDEHLELAKQKVRAHNLAMYKKYPHLFPKSSLHPDDRKALGI